MLKTALTAKNFLNTTAITRVARASALALTGLMTATAPALAINDNALPAGGNVASGSATINYGSNQLNINQSSNRVVIDWESFDIGKDAGTRFYQPGKSSVAVNRVHDTNPSQILGNLRANGQVVILNQNGVFFGHTAKVDVAGLLASTGTIDADEFMNTGAIKLSNINTGGKIINEGQITIGDAGLAAFVAPEVINSGIIEAKLGKIALASGGNQATVDLYGDGLVEMVLDADASKALITNTGTLKADGGTIAITAKGAAGVVDSVINMGGIVEANVVGTKNGKIVLGATNADVNVTGHTKANSITINSTQDVDVATSADFNADAGQNGDGGSIKLIAQQNLIFRGRASARGGSESGNGGFVETSGLENISIDGEVDASAANGQGGTWLIDPRNVTITNSGPFGISGNNNRVNVTNIINSLNTGTNVNVTTSGGGSADGDIFIDATINKTLGANASLTLTANDDISFTGGSGISSTSNALNVNMTAGDDITINRAISTNGGNVNLDAGGDISIESNITTNGGAATFHADNEFHVDSGRIVSTASALIDGTIGVFADIFDLDGSLNADTGTVQIAREDDTGRISIGDDHGGMAISQGELNRITASNLTIGQKGTGGSGTGSHDNDLYIDNADLDAFNLVTLNSKRNDSSSDQDVVFEGTNYVKNLTVHSDDEVELKSNASLNSTGDISLNGNENNLSSGDFHMGTGSKVDTNGHNLSSYALNTKIDHNAVIDAEGGNISLNNKNIFFSTDADSVKTVGTGTIDIYQNVGGKIQNAINAILNTGSGQNTVHVGNGTYTENVALNQKNLKLISNNGRGVTTINGIAGAGALGTVVIENGINNTQVGDTNQGFTINGFDSANPGIENAAVYFQGAHDGSIIKGNKIVAKGDEALVTEYGQSNNNITIDGNIITGNTFTGADGAWGTGDQFVNPNVPRQLVALNFGNSNTTFSNNEVTGNAGSRQLVAIESNTANVFGNNFDGLSEAAALRVRGSNINIYRNTIDGNGRGIGIESDKNTSNLTIGSTNAADGNVINNTGKDGISVSNATGVTKILNNLIGLLGLGDSIGSGAAGGDAIFVTNTDGAIIQSNKTANTHYNGPLRKGSGILVTNSDNVVIGGAGTLGNDVALAGSDGIVIRTDGGTADNNTIEGNTIHGAVGSRTGIYTEGATHTKILNNTINGTGRYAAIYGYGGSDFTIAGNILNHNDEMGILVQYAGGTNLIDNNTIDNTGENVKNSDGTNVGNAIHVQGSSNLTISNNTIGKNGGNIRGDGVYVSGSNGAKIKGNTINDTQFKTSDANGSNGSGIQVVNTDGVTIGGAGSDRNTITNAQWDGIRLQNDNNVTADNNSIDNTGRVGIWGGNINTATIKNNIVKNDHLGGYGSIHADGGSNWTVTGNDVDFGDYGIRLNGTSGTNLLDNNSVDNVTADGIYLDGTPNATVSNNKIGKDGGNIGNNGISVINSSGTTLSSNQIAGFAGTGIYIDPSPATIVTGNNIVGGLYGVHVALDSDNSSVTYNTITGSTVAGVLVDGGSDNTTVAYNTIDGAATGVHVANSGGARVSHNSISNAQTGVFATQASDIWVYDNDILNASAFGVRLTDTNGTNYTDDADIWYNRISGTGANRVGIQVENSKFATIGAHQTNQPNADDALNGNAISGGARGIVVVSSDNAMVRYNKVNNVGSDGIYINNSDKVTVRDNTINGTGWDGVAIVGDSDEATVLLNNISNVRASGVAVMYGSDKANVEQNTIRNAQRLGVYVWNSNELNIKNNDIKDVGLEGGGNWFLSGIHLEGSSNSTIEGNLIRNTGGDAIHIGGNGNQAAQATSGNKVLNNVIGFETTAANSIPGTNNVKGDGVFADNSTNVQIKGNKITETHSIASDKGSGIQVINTSGAVIGAAGAGNTITNSGWDGIRLQNDTNVTVEANSIDNTERVGIWGGNVNTASIKKNIVKNDYLGGYGTIHADGGSNWTVVENNVDGAGDFGIYLNGVSGTNLVDKNEVDGVSNDGIRADNTSGLTVSNNKIGTLPNTDNSIGGDGIEINNSDGALVTKNTIKNAVGNGIYNNSSDGTTLSDNTITNVDANGILINPSNNVLVTGNTITSAALNGIKSLLSNFVTIKKNTVTTTGENGILISGGDTVVVGGPANLDGDKNTVTDTTLDGIHAETVSNLTIQKNTVYDNGDDGIDVYNSASAQILSNKVGKSGPANKITDNGIEVTDSASVNVAGNSVANVGTNGIFVDPSPFATISGNSIVTAGLNGIAVLNSDDVTIYNNTIGDGVTNFGATQDGINVVGSKRVKIDKNTITGAFLAVKLGAGRDGIHVENSQEASITNNTIVAGKSGSYGAGNDGIYVINSGAMGTNNKKGVQITGNKVIGLLAKGAVHDGIHVENSANKGSGAVALIDNNTLLNIGNDGIYVTGTKDVAISNNSATGLGDDGIDVSNSSGAKVTDNTVTGAVDNGIILTGGSAALIKHNKITGVGTDGINATNVATLFGSGLTIDDNTITGAGDDGIDVASSSPVVVKNNKITGVADNGIILTGALSAKILNNTVTGAGTDGINATNVLLGGLNIEDNTITGVGDDGIDVASSGPVTIKHNKVTGAADNGIILAGGALAKILDNTILGVGSDGINASGIIGLTIDNNSVTGAGDDGIDVDNSGVVVVSNNTILGVANNGIEATKLAGASINDNDVTGVGNNGIDLRDSALVSIDNNFVTLAGGDGIFVDPSIGISITGNNILAVAGDGIYAEYVLGLLISGNTVSVTGDDGIDVQNSAGVVIANNNTSLTLGDGIQARNTLGLVVAGNTVALAGDDGIDLENTLGAVVAGNNVLGVLHNGIEVSNAAGVLLAGNNVLGTGGNGIDLDYTLGTLVVGNNVIGTLGDGIHVDHSALSLIAGNFTFLTLGDGISLSRSIGAGILGNTVIAAGDDGIDIEDAALVAVAGNNVIGTLANGIEVSNAAGVLVAGNNVVGTVGNGIDLDYTIGTLVLGNNVVGTLGDGIRVNHSALSLIAGNNTLFTLGDGIDVRNSAGVGIVGNDVAFAGDDGIDVDNSDYVLIAGNDVDFVLRNGIEFSNGENAIIGGNDVGLNGYVGGNGIDIRDANDILVASNTVGSHTQGDGIFIDPSFNITLNDNLINEVGGIGIHVAGLGNGLITLSGNTVNALKGHVGARFESGQIDMTGASNTFNGGSIGLEFDGPEVSLVGDTLGTTIFNGQADYYIALYNGALFNPGTPTLIDASQVSFDGVVTGTNDLQGTPYGYLEAMILDFDDTGTEGQIFFTSLVNGANFNDILPEQRLSKFAPRESGSVTILGLPFAQALGNLNLPSLANISPAAGGDDKGDQEQASAYDLNELDTAAGSENASCWGQVYNHFTGASAPVTYNLDTAPDALLNAQASCGGTTGFGI